MTPSNDQNMPIYSIGTVASLSGLSPNTIRTWERRYQVVEPRRSPAGGRRYGDQDVERLLLLRQLTNMGVSISSAARLENSELRERLGQVRKNRPTEPRPISVALLHPELGIRLKTADSQWEIVQQSSTPGQLARLDVACDILIAGFDALGSEPEVTLEECLEKVQARSALVLYQFARREDLKSLSSAGVPLLQEPVGLGELVERVTQQVRSEERTPGEEPVLDTGVNPRPRFTPARIAHLREVASRLRCECPNHLATILSLLLAFEGYSQTCAEESPEDAALHRKLYRETGRARGIIEDLLSDVISLED